MRLYLFVSGQSFTETYTGWSCRQPSRGSKLNIFVFTFSFCLFLSSFIFSLGSILFLPLSVFLSTCQACFACFDMQSYSSQGGITKGLFRSCDSTLKTNLLQLLAELSSRLSVHLPAETIIVNMCLLSALFFSPLCPNPTPSTPSRCVCVCPLHGR